MGPRSIWATFGCPQAVLQLYPCGYFAVLVIDVHRHHIWAGLTTAFLLQCLIATFQYCESQSSGRRFSGQVWLDPSSFVSEVCATFFFTSRIFHLCSV